MPQCPPRAASLVLGLIPAKPQGMLARCPLPSPTTGLWHPQARDAPARALSPRPPRFPRHPPPATAGTPGLSLPAPSRSVPPAPLTHQLVPLQDALPGNAFDGHLQAIERGRMSSSPAPPHPWPSCHTRPSRPLTGLPSERRMPANTVPKPPLPSCGPSWYSSCSCFFCPAAKSEPSASRPGPLLQVPTSQAGRPSVGHAALTCRSRGAARQAGTVAVPGVTGCALLLWTAGATTRGMAQGSLRSICKADRAVRSL